MEEVEDMVEKKLKKKKIVKEVEDIVEKKLKKVED